VKKLRVSIDVTDQEGNFILVKFFDRQAERLVGFTAKELIALQEANNNDAINAKFAAFNIITVRTFRIRVAENKFDGCFEATAF